MFNNASLLKDITFGIVDRSNRDQNEMKKFPD